MAGYKNPKMLTAADKKYCSSCIYKGSFAADYLCNFFVITGMMRGCPAGVGCNQRRSEPIFVPKPQPKIPTDKLPPSKLEIKCIRCGNTFIGSKKARYCEHCRRIRLHEGHLNWTKSKECKENE